MTKKFLNALWKFVLFVPLTVIYVLSTLTVLNNLSNDGGFFSTIIFFGAISGPVVALALTSWITVRSFLTMRKEINTKKGS